MTAVAEIPAKAAQPTRLEDEPRILLHNIRWETYDLLCRDSLGQRVRMNYDGGRLEFVTISRLHEIYKSWLGRFIEILVEELELNMEYGGSMTLRREDVEKGLEGDNSYWIENAALVRGKNEPDFRHDPPPDLEVEVELSPPKVSRLSIYAAFRVPQVWCFDGQVLRVGLLQADGTYSWGETSPTFPGIPVADIATFLQQVVGSEFLPMVQRFRDWVRAHLGRATGDR